MNAVEPSCPASPAADAMLPVPWRVVRRWRETHDVFSIALEPLADDHALRFLPGQFNMLYAFGTGESAISVSGDPAARDGLLVHTIREAGMVTQALGRLEPGDQLGLRGPFGSAWPLEAMEGRDLVFVAGGIGLAPLRPAIYAALVQRERFGRIVLLIGARTPEDVLYLDELDAWGALSGVECRVTVDSAPLGWTRQVGVVTKLVAGVGFDLANACAMICGPEIMMRYSAAALRQRGVGDDRIFITMERNMKCAVGFCGHCQFGPEFICRDGPVFRYDRIRHWFSQREV
jgi:NAD(P)H-flavin reductase